MIVRTVYTLRRCGTLDEATEYAGRISRGAGRHADSELEIQYDPKYRASPGTPAGSGFAINTKALEDMAAADEADDQEKETEGGWSVVVVNESMPPGGKPCAECDKPHFEDDFLCPDCRALG